MSKPASRRGRSKVERMRDRGDVRRLLRILRKHDWRVDREGRAVDFNAGRRVEAVTALGTLGAAEAEDGVLLALGDRDPRVRRAAVEALRPAPSLRAVKALARTVGAWRDPELDEVREAAVELLVELGDELHAVEYAQALVDDGQRSSLRDAEASAVRRLFEADSGPVAEIFANQLALRIGAAGEPEREVALQTMVAMGDLAVAPLLSALDDPARQQPAVRALGALRDPRAVEPLIGLLSAGDAALRADAARALGSIRHPSALDGLVRASGDRDAAVRDAAIEALDHMRGVVLGILVAEGRADPEPEPLPAPDGGARTPQQRPADRVNEDRSLLQRLLAGDADARRAALIALRGRIPGSNETRRPER